jgi:hypothetical protein
MAWFRVNCTAPTILRYVIKDIGPHNRPAVAQRVPGGFRRPDFHDIRHVKVVRLSASRTGRLYPQEMFLVLIFTRAWVDPRAAVRSEGNMSLKHPVTPPAIDPGTVRLVAQCLNHYATLGPTFHYYYYYYYLYPRCVACHNERINYREAQLLCIIYCIVARCFDPILSSSGSNIKLIKITVYCVLYTVYCLLYTVYCVLYTVYYLQYTVYCVLYTVYCVLFTAYCILYTVYYTLCAV